VTAGAGFPETFTLKEAVLPSATFKVWGADRMPGFPEGGPAIVTAEDADFVGSAVLVAVTEAAVVLATPDGAVYNPADVILPALADHVTPGVGAAITVAENCWVCPGSIVTWAGETWTVVWTGAVGGMLRI
jgi:hypothetical protein